MPNRIENLKSIDKKADVFLDGKVIARNMIMEDEKQCSLGYVLPGTYEVTVEESESVEVLGGDFTILLPGLNDYVSCKEGDKFYIPAGGSYKMIVNDFFDYFCIFGL